MPSPADCIRLQIRDRVIAVLQAITAGADYNLKPKEVLKKWVHPNQTKGDTYCVFPDDGGAIEETGAPDDYTAELYLNITGWVFDNSDPSKKVFQATADIMKAINLDSKLGTAGSLGAMDVRCSFPEMPETDDGYMSINGIGWFSLRVKFDIAGDYGEI